MDSLWSMSTTVREANRIYGFLNVAKKIEGEVWNKETQGKFQILLVQYREYLNDVTNGQTGKWVLSFFTVGMYVGSGVWKVGVGAKNTFSSILGRAAGRFIANYVPNYMFENLF